MTVLQELVARARRAPDPELDELVGEHVLDAVACLASGAASPLAGRLAGVAAPGSLLVRGTLIHIDEFDAVHAEAGVVPAAVALPPALELAPDGRTLADAYVAGTEVVIEAALRFGGARLYSAGWWPTALFGALGAAMAASVCLSLDEATTVQALALAAAPTGGLFSVDRFADGHYLLAGQAAERGVWAARAAAEGCTASTTLLDGPATTALGRAASEPGPEGTPHLLAAEFKAWPCARPLHAALTALAELVADGVDLSGASSVEVGLPTAALRFVSDDADPPGPAEAAASAAVVVAGAARGRADDPRWYRDPQPGPQVRLRAEPALDADVPRRWGAEVDVDGTRRRVRSPSPVPREQLTAKAARLLGVETDAPLLGVLSAAPAGSDLAAVRASLAERAL